MLIVVRGAFADPAPRHPSLSHGINITAWFRFPASSDPAALARYLGDRNLAGLRRAGFDFVRLAIDPDLPTLAPAEVAAISRLQRAGFAVIVSPHPRGWRLESDPAPLRRFWRAMAPRLRGLDPSRTLPEIVNEPVFPHDPAGWAALQHAVLADIRAVLPDMTVVLTGQDWGSVGGLLALTPEPDPNVLYSFHFYDPSELTSLAAWAPGADPDALSRLPFPVADPGSCVRQATPGAGRARATPAVGHEQVASAGGPEEAMPGAAPTAALTTALAGTYCGARWDAAHVAAPIHRASDWARRNGVRLIAGEFGASARLNRPARLAWISAARSAFAAEDIPWALWGYDDIMGFAVPRPPSPDARLDPGLLRALGLQTGM